MHILDDYFELQNKIHEYFGYVEDWCAIPLDDSREYFWRLEGDGPGEVLFSLNEDLTDEDDLYSNQIYTQRFLPKWVYRGEDYTMVVVDTQVDGNKFLQIFDNKKERPSV